MKQLLYFTIVSMFFLSVGCSYNNDMGSADKMSDKGFSFKEAQRIIDVTPEMESFDLEGFLNNKEIMNVIISVVEGKTTAARGKHYELPEKMTMDFPDNTGAHLTIKIMPDYFIEDQKQVNIVFTGDGAETVVTLNPPPLAR